MCVCVCVRVRAQIQFCCNIDQIDCHNLVARIPALSVGVCGLKYGMRVAWQMIFMIFPSCARKRLL
jgi:hypothetical protein